VSWIIRASRAAEEAGLQFGSAGPLVYAKRNIWADFFRPVGHNAEGSCFWLAGGLGEREIRWLGLW
jgi:hypothetical protein